MSKWVVASGQAMEVAYLGFEQGDGLSIDSIDYWWFVAPGKASSKPGGTDYVRFSDESDAAAWVLKICARLDDHSDPDIYPGNHPYWVRRIE